VSGTFWQAQGPWIVQLVFVGLHFGWIIVAIKKPDSTSSSAHADPESPSLVFDTRTKNKQRTKKNRQKELVATHASLQHCTLVRILAQCVSKGCKGCVVTLLLVVLMTYAVICNVRLDTLRSFPLLAYRKIQVRRRNDTH
jgi:hypothetical protein